MLPSETRTGDELLVLARSADGQRVMYLDFDSEPVTRWMASSADAAVGANDPVVATDTMVFVAAERFIYALDRATGTPEYTLGLPDQVATYCRDCVQIFDGDDPMLVVLTADGTLTALRAETGASRWATRLPSDSSRQLLSIGGDPTVITGTDGTDGAVQTYEIDTGQPTFAQVPQCDGPGGRVNAVDYLVPAPDGGYLWVGNAGSDGCVQRWAPGAASATWTTVLDAGSSAVRTDASESSIVGDRLVVPGRGGFWSVSVPDGAVSLVERSETDAIVPVGVMPNGIVIAEESDRGSGGWSLVGVPNDPTTTGWQFALTGEQLLPDRLAVPNQRGWLTGVSGSTVVVVDVDDEAGTITFTMVDTATGLAGEPTLLTTDDGSGDLDAVFRFTDGRITLGIDRRVLVADVTTGEVVIAAP